MMFMIFVYYAQLHKSGDIPQEDLSPTTTDLPTLTTMARIRRLPMICPRCLPFSLFLSLAVPFDPFLKSLTTIARRLQLPIIFWRNLLNNVCQVTAPTAIFKGDADSLTALEDINRLVRCKSASEKVLVEYNQMLTSFCQRKSNLLTTFVFVFLILVVNWTTLFRCPSCRTWCWTILWRLRAGPIWIISVRLRHHVWEICEYLQ